MSKPRSRKRFSKPFCSLEPTENKPTPSRCATELKIGRRGKHEIIDSVVVDRSAPCGSTWYIAKKLVGAETEKEILYDAIAKVHHSYPCTATMSADYETKEPNLHMGGFMVREEIEKALNAAERSYRKPSRSYGVDATSFI